VIDLDQYGALGVIARQNKISAPAEIYFYVEFSETPDFPEVISSYSARYQQELQMLPKAGRYMRIRVVSYSTAGTYQYKIVAYVTPFPLYPYTSQGGLDRVPISIRDDIVGLARSTDIPVPYRFAQTYSVAAGGNTGRISIDLNNYKDCAIYILADQATSITIEGSTDNTNWEAYDSGSGTANTAWKQAYTLFTHRYLGITVTNSGTATATVKVRVIASKF
jgi:hypothetical protein